MKSLSACLLLLYVNVQAQVTEYKDTVQLKEVVVTGQYQPQSIRQSVYKIRTIDRKKLEQRGVTSLIEALNMENGIRFSTDQTLGETDIQLMGVSGQNVKILLDGIPLVDRGATRQSLSQIDINQVERIEILEGPMSVVYGTDALAGVINIITRRNQPKEQWQLTARILEETSGTAYSPISGSGIHNAGISSSWQNKGWRIAGSVTRNSFGGWTGNAIFPAMEARPKDQYLGGIQMGKRTTNSDTWYRLDVLDEKLTSIGAMNTNNYKGKDQFFLTRRYTHQLQHEWRIKPSLKWQTAASYQQYQRNTETYQQDYTTGIATPVYGAGEWDRSVFNTLFLRSTMNWYAGSTWALQPGIEWKRDQTSGERILGKPVIMDYSFFITGEWKPNEVLQIKPGIRISKNSVYDAPPIIPSINARIRMNDRMDLRLSYAQGFRAPILRELYFYYFDANHAIQGNPDLKAETSNSYMAVINWYGKQEQKPWKTAASFFYNDFRNRIGMAAGQNNVFTYINIDRFKTIGGGLEQTLGIGNLQATIGFQYIGRYNQYADDPTFTETALPEFVWSPELNTQIQYELPKQGINIGFYYKYTGALPNYQTRVNATTQAQEVYLTKLSAFHWADLTASKRIGRSWQLQAGLKNLFNVVRLQNSSAGGGAHSDGGPVLTGFGRSAFIGITYTLSNNPTKK